MTSGVGQMYEGEHVSEAGVLCGWARGTRRAAAVLALAVVASLCAPALAAEPAEIVAKMDAALNAADSQSWEFDVTTIEPGKDQRVIKLRVEQLGEKRLTQFLAPGDVKGTKVLSLSSNQMYIYLPAYDKVRRVASHMTKAGFMGTTYSEAEMSITHYGPLYEFVLTGETDATWSIEGTPRPDMAAAYPKIQIDVRKDNSHPAEIRYFNDKGQKVKSEKRSRYSCQDQVCTAEVMKMTDHTKAGMHTTFKRVAWNPAASHSSSKFSKRALTRK